MAAGKVAHQVLVVKPSLWLAGEELSAHSLASSSEQAEPSCSLAAEEESCSAAAGVVGTSRHSRSKEQLALAGTEEPRSTEAEELRRIAGARGRRTAVGLAAEVQVVVVAVWERWQVLEEPEVEVVEGDWSPGWPSGGSSHWE